MSGRALAAALLLAAGCGYGFTPVGGHVPEEARSISIRLFDNRTREYGLDVRLRQAVQDEFRRRGPLRVVDEESGDLVMTGSIRRFATVPVAFSAVDEAVQYQGVMQVAVRLRERASGRVLYETKNLQATQDFGAVRGVVITTSPHFQLGTIDARDLPNLTNVQLGETGRRQAQRELLDVLAVDIYLQTMEGF